MKKLKLTLSAFVLLMFVQFGVLTVDSNAGVVEPEEGPTAVLVCQFKPNNSTYNVVIAELAGICEEAEPEGEEDGPCSTGSSCAECLQELRYAGFEIEKSNEVTNNRVVYVLEASGYFLCIGDDDDDDGGL